MPPPFQKHSYQILISRFNHMMNVNTNDLGASLNNEFEAFHRLYLPQLANLNQMPNFSISQAFETEIIKFLDNEVRGQSLQNAHVAGDKLFENFTTITNLLMSRGEYFLTTMVWRQAISVVSKWEHNRKIEVHKGTPYYFWAEAEILNGNVDFGFMLMHRALEEDKRYWQMAGLTLPPTTPGYYFVSLNSKSKNQHFLAIVKKMRRVLQKRIWSYRQVLKGKLTIRKFEKNFLQNPKHEDLAFYFVYSLFLIARQRQSAKLRITDSNIARNILIRSIFNLTLILEQMGRSKGMGGYIKDHLSKIGGSRRWKATIDYNLFSPINRQFKSNPDVIIQNFLDYNFNVSNFKHNKKLSDYAFACGMRNYCGHGIVTIPDVISSNFRPLTQHLFNPIFWFVENYL